MIAQRLTEVATSARLDSLLAAAVSSVPVTPAVQRMADSARGKVDGMRELAAGLAAPDAEEELYTLLAAFWLELRCEWERYNVLIGYQIVQHGEAEPHVVAGGTLASGLMEWIEEIVPRGAVERLGELAISLLDRIRHDVDEGHVTPIEGIVRLPLTVS